MPLPEKRPSLYCNDPTSPWAKFFAPSSKEAVPQFLVPKDWANFFTTLLMSPKHFNRAKELIQSKALLSCISNGQSIGFSLPSKRRVKSLPACTLWSNSDSLAEDTDVDPLEAPPLDGDVLSKNLKK